MKKDKMTLPNKEKTYRPIYEGLIIGDGLVQKDPVPEHVIYRGDKAVVQDKVYVDKENHMMAISDGITGSGMLSANVAEIVVKELTEKFYGTISKYFDYEKIFDEIETHTATLDRAMHKRFGASATYAGSHITSDRKLISYRIGDSEARIIRDGKIYHIDDFLTEHYEPLFEGEFIGPTYSRGRRMQARGYNIPNQIGAYVETGRLTVHQLEYGDRIILSSDGFNKPFGAGTEIILLKTVELSKTPQEAENALIDKAVKFGLFDDYSVIVAFNDTPGKKAIRKHDRDEFWRTIFTIWD